MTRVRNFEDARFGEYLIKTWYYSPYPRPTAIDDRAASPQPVSVNGPNQAQKKRKLNGDVLESKMLFHSGTSNGSGGLKKERSVQDIYAASMSKAGEAVRGRIWVCDVSYLQQMARYRLRRPALLQIYARKGPMGEAHREWTRRILCGNEY